MAKCVCVRMCVLCVCYTWKPQIMINWLWILIYKKKESNSHWVLCLRYWFSLTFNFLQNCLAPAYLSSLSLPPVSQGQHFLSPSVPPPYSVPFDWNKLSSSPQLILTRTLDYRKSAPSWYFTWSVLVAPLECKIYKGWYVGSMSILPH